MLFRRNKRCVSIVDRDALRCWTASPTDQIVARPGSWHAQVSARARGDDGGRDNAGAGAPAARDDAYACAARPGGSAGPWRVLMVRVVAMPVLVFHRFVHVLVFVVFRQVQPQADAHQAPGHQQRSDTGSCSMTTASTAPTNGASEK